MKHWEKNLTRAEMIDLTTFEQQTDVTLNQANPVQNTWYTFLGTTKNVRLMDVRVKVATTGETLEGKLTVDGQTETLTAVAASNDADYGPRKTRDSANLFQLDRDWFNYPLAFLLEGRSVKGEVRKTTATGTGNLISRVKYGKR